jgi:hypothetical protein
MEKHKESFAIIKEMSEPNGKSETLIVDTHSEVLEFDLFEEADNIAKIMEANSNHGYKYRVRKVGSR